MKLRLLCSILLLFSFGKVFAQNYPVQVTPQFLPPSPIYLSSYADGTTINSPLRVQLLLNDITLSNREVRLKIYIEGTGINLQGSDLVIGSESIYLDGGVPLTLTNELAPYFELKNMQGINPANYANPLSEGSYQFCFEVYDAFTGNKLSNKTCASTLIFQNDPPFLNMPFKDEEIAVNNPQNIVFQWTPRHINVSNVEYELSIVEIWDHYVDPQAAFFSMPPIFQVTTRNTSYLMGPSDPPLLPNKKYAWRVKAKALQGAEEIGLFKNHGYSEIYWFNHTQPCEAPPGLYAELKGASKVNIFWEPNPEAYKSYTIAYREAGNTESDWYFKTTNSDWVTIWDLKPGTTYEYMVKGICELGESEYSESQTITTELLDNSDSFYSCGLVPDEIAISNREPLPTLIPGDEIYAGDFVVTVTDVSGGNGIYSGRGYVKIPYLNLITLRVTFNGILVNTAHQLAEGEIVTLYDPAFGEGAEMTVDVSLNFSNASTLDYEDIYVDGEIQSVIVNSEGNIVVQTTSGPVTINTQGESPSGGGLAVEPGTPVKIKDDAGNEYTVVDGVVTQGGGESITNENSNELTGAGKALVTFEKAPQSRYGLDVYKKEYESTKLKRFYPEVEAGEKNYFVSWKALASGKMEPLLAKIEVKDNGLDLNKISFETNTGAKYTSQGGTNAEERTVQLAGKGNMQEEELYALYPTDSTALTLGRINTVSYDEVRHKVVVVPLGENSKYPGSATELQNGLNTIYSQAAVTWEVELLQAPLGVTYNSPLIVGEKGNNYISSLKEIINAYKRTNPVNKNTYYLFIADKLQNESGKDVEGYMLRGGQYGFIAVNSQNIIKTIAHELGHGAFHLKHAFSKYDVSETSDNLMSYSNGFELVKDQWDDIHNPALIIGLLESDEDGEHYTTKGLFKNLNFGNNSNNTFTFITPSGQSLILPENVEDVTKFFGYYGFSEILNENFNQFISIVPGTIREFKIEDKVFTAVIEKQGDDFVLRGYYNKETEYKPEDYNINISDSYENKGIIFAFGLEENTYGYTAYSLNTDELSVFEGNGNIKDILSFPVQYRGSSIEKKTIPFEPGNKQFSMSPENLQWVFNSEYFNNSDGTLFIRNKIAEFRALYPELVNQITARYSKWSENNICNYNSLFNSFENHLKAEFCIAHSVEQPLISNPTIVTTTLVYELNSQKTLPSTQLEWQQLYYQYIKDNALNTSEQIGISLSEFNTVSLIPEFSCIDITTIINSASQNDIMLLSTEAILHLVSHYMLHGCTSEGYTLYNDFESAIVKLIKNSNPAIAKEIILGLESKNKYDDSEYLYEQLFWALDDDYLFGLSSNNRNKLISACTDLMFRNTDFYSERLDDAIDKIENRVFIFEYNNILKNSAKTIIDAFSYINISGLLTKEAVHKDWQYYDISYVFNKDGTIKLAQTKDFGWLDSENVFEDHFKPFDLVIFVNKSNVSLVKEYLKANEDLTQYPIPAIALSYASQAGSNQTSSDAIYASLDVIGAVGSGGTLATVKGLTKLRKILLVSDLLSSGTGLTSTAISDNEQLADIKNSLDDVSRILGIAGMAENFVPSGSSPRQILKKVKDNIGDNTEIPTNQQIENVFNTIENASYEKLKILSTEASDDAKTIELLLVKRIKDAADANNTADFNKANKVLKKLKDARSLVSNTGKIVVGEKNILPVESIAGEFKSFTYKVENGANPIPIQKRAGTFWNSVPAESVQYLSLDGKYYVKVVPTDGDGRLLFFDVNNNKCIGWGILPKEGGKLLNKLESAEDYESLIKDLKFIHGIENTTSVIDFGDKGTLIRSLGKVNAYLGSYNPQRALGDVSKELGTQDVLNKFAIYKNYAFADNAKDMAPGSILMLNIPDEMYRWETFFDDFNQEFLDYLINNKDKMEIIFTTKPEYQDLFKVWDNDVNDYKYNRSTKLYEPSGFAKEIKYLRDRGIKTVKFKDGTTINLDDVDLSEMDWITNWKY